MAIVLKCYSDRGLCICEDWHVPIKRLYPVIESVFASYYQVDADSLSIDSGYNVFRSLNGVLLPLGRISIETKDTDTFTEADHKIHAHVYKILSQRLH